MRYIDGDKAIEDAEYLYNLYVMAMANADTQREINHVFKRQELFKAVKAVVEHCPTIDPVKHGEWMNTYGDTPHDPRDKNYWWHCSECGHSVSTSFKSNFCPHCGAKMGGDKE